MELAAAAVRTNSVMPSSKSRVLKEEERMLIVSRLILCLFFIYRIFATVCMFMYKECILALKN